MDRTTLRNVERKICERHPSKRPNLRTSWSQSRCGIRGRRDEVAPALTLLRGALPHRKAIHVIGGAPMTLPETGYAWDRLVLDDALQLSPAGLRDVSHAGGVVSAPSPALPARLFPLRPTGQRQDQRHPSDGRPSAHRGLHARFLRPGTREQSPHRGIRDGRPHSSGPCGPRRPRPPVCPGRAGGYPPPWSFSERERRSSFQTTRTSPSRSYPGGQSGAVSGGGRAEPPGPGGPEGVGNFREGPLCLFRSTPAAGSPAPRLTPSVVPAARGRDLIISRACQRRRSAPGYP